MFCGAQALKLRAQSPWETASLPRGPSHAAREPQIPECLEPRLPSEHATAVLCDDFTLNASQITWFQHDWCARSPLQSFGRASCAFVFSAIETLQPSSPASQQSRRLLSSLLADWRCALYLNSRCRCVRDACQPPRSAGGGLPANCTG